MSTVSRATTCRRARHGRDCGSTEAGLSYPERLNVVTELLDRHVDEGRGGRTAIIAPGLEWSYADLAER
jgi:2-aminobenzoate-CoA ligase